MDRKKLPIGIQTFKTIREENFVYVDKTGIAFELIQNGRYYFLSRPRRFGKSLFIDTLAEIFQGNKVLFEGLDIYDKWDWETTYPVIKINFGRGRFQTEAELEQEFSATLKFNCELLQIDYVEVCHEAPSGGAKLFNLIYLAYKKYKQQVVVLVDEYDKPIIDNISDQAQAKKIRDLLAVFYSTIKSCDPYLRFVMLAGVSKFSKVNLFSNLNNLKDITVDKRYATITGYTHQDLQRCFADYLDGVDLEMVKRWYNGYNYLGEAIYNPFDILLFLIEDGKFKNYWWESGNPSFLIELLKKQTHYLPELGNIIVSQETLNSFDVDHIDLIALLWQTGYLTFAGEIIDEDTCAISYKMKVPNLEIQRSLNALFLDYLTNLNGENTGLQLNTAKALREGDCQTLNLALKRLFAAIPYNNYTKNIIANYEGYYSSVFFTHITSIGYEVIPEDVTNKGRIDLTVKIRNKIFIFEFKVDSNDEPLEQIKRKKYYEKYLGEAGKEVYLIGINFSSSERNITEFTHELLAL